MQATDPVQERQAGLTYAQQSGLSQRHACYLLTVARSTARYCPAPEPARTASWGFLHCSRPDSGHIDPRTAWD